MGFTFLTSLALSSLIATVYYSGYNLDITSEHDHQEVEREEYDLHPLFLTPLIEGGNIDDARRKSIVEHEVLRDVVSYSGFLTVDKEFNSNLFFWFFPAQMISKTAPIVIWLQGGPGDSSLLGLFSENGPFIIGKDQSLKNRENSWTEPLNMLYIDNPVGTGYSFTDHEDGYADNQLSVGLHLYEALTQFFKMFPELKTNDVYIAGESFGGKFATALGYAIHAMNPVLDDVINLKGLAIFGGSLDPSVPSGQPVQPQEHQSSSFLDFRTITQFLKYEQKIQHMIEKPSSIDMNDLFSFFSETTELLAEFNPFSEEEPKGNIKEDDMDVLSEFMENEDMKHAIHVGNRTFVVNSERVKKVLEFDMSQSLGNVFAILLENYRVLVVNGELDKMAPASEFERSLMKLNWGGKDGLKVEGKPWRVGGELAGDVKMVGKMVEVVVKNSGGSVIKEKPAWMLELITKFTGGEDIV